MKIFFLTGIIILCISCKKSAGITKDSTPTIEDQQSIKNQIQIEIEEKAYNDSMIAALVEAQLPKDEISMDKFKILHTIECNTELSGNYHFSMDSVFKFQTENLEGSSDLRWWLSVSHCYSKFQSNDIYDAYIFYSDIQESHTSQSFMIISILKESNVIDQLDLAIEYGNESGDYILSSTINQGNIIERRFNHNMRFIQGLGNVDSIFLERELYMINKEGKFERLESRLEPSNVVNQLH